MTCNHPEESYEIKEVQDPRVFYEFCEYPLAPALVCGICGWVIEYDVPFSGEDYAI